MTTQVADKNKAGLMGPNHVRWMNRFRDILKDPTFYADATPTLDWDLTDAKGTPFIGNLTRATVGGHRQNSKGILTATVAGEPLVGFKDGVPLGTEFHSAFTNLTLWSEAFGDASWPTVNASVTSDAIAAPDGATTADRLVSTITGGSNTAYVGKNTAVAAATDYTFSIYLKAGTSPVSTVNFFRVSPFAQLALTITWATLTVSVANGYGVMLRNDLEILPDGWVRISVTINSGTATSLHTRVYVRDSGTVNVTGEYVHLWGAQLTATAFPVPYVPTTSAAVTRNGDAFIMSGTDFTDFYNQLEGTIFVEGIVSPRTGFPRIFQIDDTTNNNRHALFYDAANNNLGAQTFVGGVAQNTFYQPAAVGSICRLAYSYKTNAFYGAINGTAYVGQDASGSVPTVSRLQLPGEWDNFVRRVIYWPEALDLVTLQRMTGV